MASDKQRAKVANTMSANTTKPAAIALMKRKKVMNARLADIMKGK